MTTQPGAGELGGWRRRVDRILAQRSDWVFMAPYMVYLLLLGLKELLPYEWNVAAAILRGVGGLLAFGLVLKFLPPLGKPNWVVAIGAGVACAALWVGGQHLFNWLGVPVRIPLPLFPGDPEFADPRVKLGDGLAFWSSVVARISVAVITVPIVEELFWRGFLLRALIDWDDFERIPLGRYTFWSFVGTSLLSTIQHPDNWLISIFCWFAFNGIMYWKKSLLCLMIVHGVTNLALYIYVVAAGDWIFW